MRREQFRGGSQEWCKSELSLVRYRGPGVRVFLAISLTREFTSGRLVPSKTQSTLSVNEAEDDFQVRACYLSSHSVTDQQPESDCLLAIWRLPRGSGHERREQLCCALARVLRPTDMVVEAVIAPLSIPIPCSIPHPPREGRDLRCFVLVKHSEWLSLDRRIADSSVEDSL